MAEEAEAVEGDEHAPSFMEDYSEPQGDNAEKGRGGRQKNNGKGKGEAFGHGGSPCHGDPRTARDGQDEPLPFGVRENLGDLQKGASNRIDIMGDLKSDVPR